MPSDRLQTLPGFGQVKVRRIKDAFEKPFRNNATSTLPSTLLASQSKRSNDNDNEDSMAPNRDQAKAREVDETLPLETSSRSRPPRSPSPVWDIELDLNGSPENGPPPTSETPGKSPSADNPGLRKGRSPSPMWDIELDLTGSDDDAGTVKEGFGKAALL